MALRAIAQTNARSYFLDGARLAMGIYGKGRLK
jgi:hypothetical protein